MSSRVSDETFRTRLRALVERDGIEGVQNFYNVSRRTVRRWISGETRPRSPRTASSVSRRGRAITGNVVQTRNAQGQFTTVLRGRGAQAYRVAQERTRETRREAISSALTPSEREMAEAMPDDVDIDAYVDWEQRRQNLLEAEQLGYYGDFYDYYGYDDSWEDWRADYGAIRG